MSGHNKWSQIKNQKGATDKKRGQLFSKLLKAIAVAAKTNPNPQFNPRLRAVIEKAKENNVPQGNIDRAINKASEEKSLEEVVIEAYGPEGTQIIIDGITDNTNRTIAEIKHILSEHEAKIANPGSVLWAFNSPARDNTTESIASKIWTPKFPIEISESAKEKIASLIEALENHDDVQKITTNIK